MNQRRKAHKDRSFNVPREVLVAFDLDGVLCGLNLNTEVTRTRVRCLFEKAGFEGTFRPLLKGMAEACAHIAIHDPDAADALRFDAWRIIDEDERACAVGATRFADVNPCLDRLDGMSLAVYSNNHRNSIEVALAGVGVAAGRFAGIWGRTGCASLKPSGRPLCEFIAMQRNRVERSDVKTEVAMYFVGDHPYDMESAHQAAADLAAEGDKVEVYGVGLARRVEHVDRLRAAGAHAVITTLADLPPLLR